MTNSRVVAGRGCNGCTLCCKVLKIAVLDKPPLQWCQHCAIGVGCNIYEARPAVCREFLCEYLVNPNLGEEWRPANSKIVILNNPQNKAVIVQCDSSRPQAWRAASFYGHIKQVAAKVLSSGWYLLVWEGAEAVIVLPDRDVHLGKVEAGAIKVPPRKPKPASFTTTRPSRRRDHTETKRRKTCSHEGCNFARAPYLTR